MAFIMDPTYLQLDSLYSQRMRIKISRNKCWTEEKLERNSFHPNCSATKTKKKGQYRLYQQIKQSVCCIIYFPFEMREMRCGAGKSRWQGNPLVEVEARFKPLKFSRQVFPKRKQ
jgi:hypothetical protein